MANDYVRVTDSESSARLWALEAQVRQLAGTDPAFLAAFEQDPLDTLRQRFGDAAMPNEGEHLRVLPEGGFDLVFPKTDVRWTFGAPKVPEELSDEMLDCVSAGGGVQGPSLNSGVV